MRLDLSWYLEKVWVEKNTIKIKIAIKIEKGI